MNEHQRMQYIDAMGIDMFVPRWRLPLAKASLRIPEGPSEAVVHRDIDASGLNTPSNVASETTFSETTASETIAERPVARLASVTQIAAGLVADLSNSDEAAYAPCSLKPDDAADTPSNQPSIRAVPDAAEAVRFSLEIWQPAGLLVVDSHQSASGFPTAALLFNMLRHLGYSASEMPGSELIHWPMVDLPHKPKSLLAAREMMLPLLDAKLLRAERGVLLLGRDVFRVIASDGDADRGYEACCYSAVSVMAGQRALVLPGLVDLLKDATLKPLVWQALQQHLLT